MKKRFRSTLGVNLTVIVTVELVGIILLGWLLVTLLRYFDITLKDVETVSNHPENIKRWTEIVREEIFTANDFAAYVKMPVHSTYLLKVIPL